MTCHAWKGGQCVEEYGRHIKRALTVWEKLRPIYFPAVRRAIGVDLDVVEYAIVVHDLGKLAKAYQVGRRGEYRHEVVSAYFAYKGLEPVVGGEIAAVVAAAVLLHHEPILTSAYISGLGERYLPIYAVRKMLEEHDLSPACDPLAEAGDAVNKYPELKKELERWGNGGLTPRDMLEVVKEIVVQTAVGDSARLHAMRAKAAAVLYPLVVSDSVAAHVGRSLCGCDERDKKGTKIVDLALKGAEPLDVEALRRELC